MVKNSKPDTLDRADVSKDALHGRLKNTLDALTGCESMLAVLLPTHGREVNQLCTRALTRAQPSHELDTNMNARHSVPRHPCIDDMTAGHERLAPTTVG